MTTDKSSYRVPRLSGLSHLCCWLGFTALPLAVWACDVASTAGSGGSAATGGFPQASGGGDSGGSTGAAPAGGGSGGVGGTSGGGSSASGGTGAVSETGGAPGTGAAGNTGGTGDGGTGGSANTPKFRVFLLIGQSNMSGGATPNEEDRVEDERIKVLGFDDCGATGRKYNEWDTASPPLHACWTNGIGPGDHFAKTLIEALPAGDTIGLIPSALPGAGIDMFRKGVDSSQRDDFTIPPDDHWQGAYDWMVERARLAQDDGGVIEGMIFHQGETDNGQSVWLDKVAEMVADLRSDLGIGPVPFIAGELLYGGCCQGHNDLVHQLSTKIENASYVSTAGLVGIDAFHFDPAGVRTLGARYGEAMATALGLQP